MVSATSNLKDKVIIITGAAGGLGQAIASAAIDEGATVVMTDIDVSTGQSVAEKLGANAVFYRQDVMDEQGWIDIVEQVERDYGRIDVLVNNAGHIVVAPIEQATVDQWNSVMGVCALGTFLGCKHVLAALRRSGGGAIVNVCSVAAMVGQPFAPTYCAAKGAVRSLTKAVAAQCLSEANGIRCNSVHPGGIETAMFTSVRDVLIEDLPEAQKKALSAAKGMPPADVAATVIYLASDASRGINGGEIIVDQGTTISGRG